MITYKCFIFCDFALKYTAKNTAISSIANVNATPRNATTGDIVRHDDITPNTKNNTKASFVVLLKLFKTTMTCDNVLLFIAIIASEPALTQNIIAYLSINSDLFIVEISFMYVMAPEFSCCIKFNGTYS